MIAVKFNVRGRDLGSSVAEAPGEDAAALPDALLCGLGRRVQRDEGGRVSLVVHHPAVAGADLRLAVHGVPLLLDTLVVFSNVFDVAVGGVWALYLTGTDFSISAAVRFSCRCSGSPSWRDCS